MAIRWGDDKNARLKAERGFGFEDVVETLEGGDLLEDALHPTRPHQRILVVLVKGYAVSVPYVSEGEGIFLKTAYADRKAMRRLKGRMT